jgi:hypothetical protein
LLLTPLPATPINLQPTLPAMPFILPPMLIKAVAFAAATEHDWQYQRLFDLGAKP